MPKDTNKLYSAPALEKGLDIIELLSTRDVGLGQSEIARELGRSVGEIFRMLMVLQERGYIVQDPVSDRYLLTTYIFELAHRIPKIGRLTAFADPLMRDMVKAINQSAHLAIISDDGIMVVGQVNSPGNHTITVRQGSKLGLWSASSGRVIMAFLPPEKLVNFFDIVPLPAGATKEQLVRELDEIRQCGYEVRDSFIIKGVINISAPIMDHSGEATAALTIPHIERFNNQISFEECKAKLVETAAALTRSLGGIPPS